MKKIKVLVLALIIALLIPTVAFADSGGPQYTPGWQTIFFGDRYLTTSYYTEIEVDSGGGDLEICVFNMSTLNNGNFLVSEKDPSGTDSKAHGYIYPDSNGEYCYAFSVRSYVDGDNKKAELVIGFDVNGFNEPVTIRIRD